MYVANNLKKEHSQAMTWYLWSGKQCHVVEGLPLDAGPHRDVTPQSKSVNTIAMLTNYNKQESVKPTLGCPT